MEGKRGVRALGGAIYSHYLIIANYPLVFFLSYLRTLLHDLYYSKSTFLLEATIVSSVIAGTPDGVPKAR